MISLGCSLLTFSHCPSCVYDASATVTQRLHLMCLFNKYTYLIFLDMLNNRNFLSPQNNHVFHITIL
jgi:hypothetical protein